jgi:RNA polymerase sigma-70 factor (ECF subfamily)
VRLNCLFLIDGTGFAYSYLLPALHPAQFIKEEKSVNLQGPSEVLPVVLKATEAIPRSEPQVSPRARRESQPVPWSSEEELVEAILAGSSDHFAMLYESYSPRVYAFALKRLHDTAESEDVVQEVFIAVSRSLPSFSGDSPLLSWIFGIARNKVNRRFRKERPIFETLEGEASRQVESKRPEVDREVDARRMLTHCEEMIASELTPLQRRIFHLKHFRRQSIRSIAVALGKSEDAVKANLYRMRRSLLQEAPELESLLQT